MERTREKALILDRPAIDRALTRVAHEILERSKGAKHLGLIGIQRGGVHLAKRLAAKIMTIEGIEVPVGSLDITMYRDDLNTRKSQPVPQATDISFGRGVGRRLCAGVVRLRSQPVGTLAFGHD